MQQLAISIVNVTQNLMEHADAPLTSISLINADQLAQLDSFNDNHVAFDASQTIVSLFHQQVEKYRNHTAVVYEDQRFTYEEVDALSNKIAQHLISKGVKQGDVVSIRQDDPNGIGSVRRPFGGRAEARPGKQSSMLVNLGGQLVGRSVPKKGIVVQEGRKVARK